MRKLSISLAVLAFGLLALGIFRAVTAAKSQVAPPCFTAEEQSHVFALTSAAIDTAFQAHVQNLFEVWVKDTTEQPRRATAGMANGLSAYQRAQANSRAWKPETCR